MPLTVIRNLNDKRVIAPEGSAILFDEEMEHLTFRTVIGGGCLTHEERVVRLLQGKIEQMSAHLRERSSPLQVEHEALTIPVWLKVPDAALNELTVRHKHMGAPSHSPRPGLQEPCQGLVQGAPDAVNL